MPDEFVRVGKEVEGVVEARLGTVGGIVVHVSESHGDAHPYQAGVYKVDE